MRFLCSLTIHQTSKWLLVTGSRKCFILCLNHQVRDIFRWNKILPSFSQLTISNLASIRIALTSIRDSDTFIYLFSLFESKHQLNFHLMFLANCQPGFNQKQFCSLKKFMVNLRCGHLVWHDDETLAINCISRLTYPFLILKNMFDVEAN